MDRCTEFQQKIKKRNRSTEEFIQIADVLGAVYEQSYILENKENITIISES